MNNTSIQNYMQQVGQQSKQAARALLRVTDQQKNQVLMKLAQLIENNKAQLQAANQKDLEQAKYNNLSAPLIDRLTLSNKSFNNMVVGLRQIASMDDPVGTFGPTRIRPNGMSVTQMRVPIGVIGIIYESRPNVTIDAAALCLKSGNACILRGGSEAINSNLALASLIQKAIAATTLPMNAVQVINTTDRDAVGELITMTEWVDVIIPRGGKSLLQRLSKDARVPMIMHLDGNCHMYIDEFANVEQAVTLAFHAKTYRYGICGALETLLVHSSIAAAVLPTLAKQFQSVQVEVRACTRSLPYFTAGVPATEEDWHTEFLAPIIAIRIVDSIEEAIDHISQYSSGHTEAIVTESISRAEQFKNWVDSSSVLVNLPTVFADGFEYGLGAEIGISTNRLHARGPVGLEGLTTYKWVLQGQGQTRA